MPALPRPTVPPVTMSAAKCPCCLGPACSHCTGGRLPAAGTLTITGLPSGTLLEYANRSYPLALGSVATNPEPGVYYPITGIWAGQYHYSADVSTDPDYRVAVIIGIHCPAVTSDDHWGVNAMVAVFQRSSGGFLGASSWQFEGRLAGGTCVPPDAASDDAGAAYVYFAEAVNFGVTGTNTPPGGGAFADVVLTVTA